MLAFFLPHTLGRRHLSNMRRSNRLAAVNFFLGIVGIVQMSRIAIYKMNQGENPIAEAVAEVKEEVKEKAQTS
jgi:FMN-dependent NADH-azoreductase